MLVNIQFLRFAAAFMVVLYHASKHVQAAGVDQGILFVAAESAGFAGVDVFFVISGFIMFYTTTGAVGPAASFDFIRRRAARIFSGYWPFFFLAAAVFAWARPEHFAESNLLTSFFLWPMPLNRVLLDVSWTLSYEMYFYLLFTVLVLVGIRGRFGLLAGILLLVTAYNLVQHFVLNAFGPENYYFHSFSSLFYTSPFLIEFFAGAVLARFARCGTARLGWLLLAAGIIGFTAAGFSNSLVYDGKIEQGFHVVPRVLLFGIPSVLILWGLVSLENGGIRAPKRFSLASGGASYAIYLGHTIFFVATMKLGLSRYLSDSSPMAVQAVFLVYSALIVAVSVIYYKTAERWLHRQFKRILGVASRN